MARRVLLLGTTGVAKSVAVDALQRYHHATASDVRFTYRDFEHDYVRPRFDDLHSFLDADETRQRAEWHAAWSDLLQEFPSDRPDVLLLAMHGVFVRDIYGVRSLVQIDDVRDFAPTHVVTLLDDVYVSWWRTEQRAGGLAYMGRPTPLQLLDGRHSELVVGDAVCGHLVAPGSPQRLTNWLTAVRHPARLLSRLLFSAAQDLLPVYLSFPISEPRRMAASGDVSGISEVNEFLQAATRFERENPRVTCFCPLSIDELPLLAAFNPERAPDETVSFDTVHRWNVADYYGDNEIIMADRLPADIEMVNGDIQRSEGMIRGDVAVRDYRLVKQARRLVVFNPYFNQRLSSGVDNEIAYALDLRKPVHIFQDPRHDPAGEAAQRYGGVVGALGRRPRLDLVTRHGSIEAALSAALR